jgi:nucleoid-associated protein YgaU
MTISRTSRYYGLETFEVDGVLTVAQRLTGAPPQFPDSLDHTVVGGETLDGLAKLYYGREDLWWWIADVNPGRFALDLVPGDVLTIPPIRVVTRTPRS